MDIGGVAPLTANGLLLSASFFDLGFSDYVVSGIDGMAVAPRRPGDRHRAGLPLHARDRRHTHPAPIRLARCSYGRRR